MWRFPLLLCVLLSGCERPSNSQSSVTIVLPPPAKATPEAGFSVDLAQSEG